MLRTTTRIAAILLAATATLYAWSNVEPANAADEGAPATAGAAKENLLRIAIPPFRMAQAGQINVGEHLTELIAAQLERNAGAKNILFMPSDASVSIAPNESDRAAFDKLRADGADAVLIGVVDNFVTEDRIWREPTHVDYEPYVMGSMSTEYNVFLRDQLAFERNVDDACPGLKPRSPAWMSCAHNHNIFLGQQPVVYLETPTSAAYYYTIEHHHLSSVLDATWRLVDLKTGETLQTDSFHDHYEMEDSKHPGYAFAGVPDKPLNLPSVEEQSEQILTAAADKITADMVKSLRVRYPD